MEGKYYKSSFLKLISIVLIGFIGTMLFSCENDINVVKSLQIDDFEPVEISYDINMLYTDSGRIKLRLKSPLVQRFIRDKEFTIMPKGIYVEFYDSLGHVSSMLSANYTISYAQSGIIEAKHNVVVVNLAGEKLYTEHLIWDQNKHRIYTESEVRVVTADNDLIGDGLESDEKFNNWVILYPRGNMNVKNDISN